MIVSPRRDQSTTWKRPQLWVSLNVTNLCNSWISIAFYSWDIWWFIPNQFMFIRLEAELPIDSLSNFKKDNISCDHLIELFQPWLLNSSKFHQKVRRKRSEKKVRVLFLKSTSSTIKRPTSSLKFILVKFVKKYGAALYQMMTITIL